MVTEKEGEIDKLQKELTNRDERIQQQGAEIQRQADEIKRLEADIVKKDEEIGRRSQEIVNQQTTINELSAKLPSVDLMQVKHLYIHYTVNGERFAGLNFHVFVVFKSTAKVFL